MNKNLKKLKHNKIKNSGLIFEMLIKQLTTEMINNDVAIAKKIIERNFHKNSELYKEVKIYTAIMNSKNKNKEYIYSIINEALDYSKQINIKKIQKEKFNLIKDINSNYGNAFFNTQIKDYIDFANIYKLLELKLNKNNLILEVGEETQTKENLVESLMNKEDLIEELKENNFPVDSLTYKVLIRNFNKKYSNLNEKQKEILSLFTNNFSYNQTYKEKFINLLNEIRTNLEDKNKKIDNKTYNVKINSVVNKLNLVEEKINKNKFNSGCIQTLIYSAELSELL